MMNRKRAFTLIELLVVVAIISLLVSILLPSLNQAKELARRSVCLSQSRAIATTFHFYINDWNGSFPYSGWGRYSAASRDAQWSTYLQEPYDLNRKVYACPSDPPETLSRAVFDLTYSYNRSLDETDGSWPDHQGPTASITDIRKPDNTPLITEALHITVGSWEIYNQPLVYGLGNLHDDGNNWTFVEGHAEWVEGRPLAWPYYGSVFSWSP